MRGRGQCYSLNWSIHATSIRATALLPMPHNCRIGCRVSSQTLNSFLLIRVSIGCVLGIAQMPLTDETMNSYVKTYLGIESSPRERVNEIIQGLILIYHCMHAVWQEAFVMQRWPRYRWWTAMLHSPNSKGTRKKRWKLKELNLFFSERKKRTPS